MDGCIGSDGAWVRDGLEKAGVDIGRVKMVDDEVSSVSELYCYRT